MHAYITAHCDHCVTRMTLHDMTQHKIALHYISTLIITYVYVCNYLSQ